MKKVEAIVKPFKVDDVKEALTSLGVGGMTVTDVRGLGHQPARADFYEGAEYTIDFVPKAKVEAVVPDDLVEKVISAVCVAARTGAVGDGKVFVLPVGRAVRIRTGEAGEAAL